MVKVKCIDNALVSMYITFTLGRVYEAEENLGLYNIKDDLGVVQGVPKDRFMELFNEIPTKLVVTGPASLRKAFLEEAGNLGFTLDGNTYMLSGDHETKFENLTTVKVNVGSADIKYSPEYLKSYILPEAWAPAIKHLKRLSHPFSYRSEQDFKFRFGNLVSVKYPSLAIQSSSQIEEVLEELTTGEYGYRDAPTISENLFSYITTVVITNAAGQRVPICLLRKATSASIDTYYAFPEDDVVSEKRDPNKVELTLELIRHLVDISFPTFKVVNFKVYRWALGQIHGLAVPIFSVDLDHVKAISEIGSEVTLNGWIAGIGYEERVIQIGCNKENIRVSRADVMRVVTKHNEIFKEELKEECDLPF